MITQISGNQWNEGDVSCSVVRRVALPDSFYALDAILDTSINVLSNLVINTEAIKSELNETLPFILSSKILMKAVELGMGREVAHEVIKVHARNAFAHYQKTGVNNFFELVSNDKRLGVSKDFLVNLLVNPLQHSGRAQEQCNLITSKINLLCLGRKDVSTYLPQEPI
jgi:adenylosuccinate lyase